MRVAGVSVVALIVLVVSLACGGSESDGSDELAGSRQLDAKSIPVVDCQTRMQTIPDRRSRAPLPPRSRRASVIAGPAAFIAAKQLRRLQVTPRGGRRAPAKAPIRVAAGSPVRIALTPRTTRRAVISVGRDRGTDVRAPAVELRPCPPDAEVAGRRVGAFTPFAAGFELDGPTCVRLRVSSVGDAQSYRRQIPVGKQCSSGRRGIQP